MAYWAIVVIKAGHPYVYAPFNSKQEAEDWLTFNLAGNVCHIVKTYDPNQGG